MPDQARGRQISSAGTWFSLTAAQPPAAAPPSNPGSGFAVGLATRKLEDGWSAPFFEQFLENQQIHRPGETGGTTELTQMFPSESDLDQPTPGAYPSDSGHDVIDRLESKPTLDLRDRAAG